MDENYSPNPFSIASDFKPHFVVGHKRLLLTLVETITATDPQIVNLIGPRWIGKTTLLKYIAHPTEGVFSRSTFRAAVGQTFRESRLIVLYFDMNRDLIGSETPWGILGEELFEKLSTVSDFNSNSVAPNLQLGLSHSQLTDSETFNRLINLTEITYKKRFRVIFCIDHLDRSKQSLNRNMVRQIEELSEFSSFIISSRDVLGSHQPVLVGSPIIHKSTIKIVGLIDDQSARQLLQSRITKTQVTFSPEDLDLLIQYVGRHPFLLLAAASQAFDYLVSSKFGKLTKNFLLSDVDTSLRPFHQHLWQQHKSDLLIFFECEHPAGCTIIKHIDAITHLKEKAIIVPDNSGLVFFSSLFKRFVEKKIQEVVPTKNYKQYNELLSILEIDAKTKEGRLLYLLVSQPNEVVFDRDVLPMLWSEDPDNVHALQTTVARLQSKFKKIWHCLKEKLSG